MRISNPHHPHHYIRQSMVELRQRAKPGDKFRLEMSDGTPILCKVVRWKAQRAIGTSLTYQILKTGEEKTFSWMNPGGVVTVQPVDSSKDGLDFAGIAHEVAKRAASKARKERELRIEAEDALKQVALACNKQERVLKQLAAKLKEKDAEISNLKQKLDKYKESMVIRVTNPRTKQPTR